MPDKITYKINDPVFEGMSYDIAFDCQQIDNTPLVPSSVKVYILLSGNNETPTYINGRNGTNLANLVTEGSNIAFHLSPADNALAITPAGNNYFETHSIVFEAFYNDDADKFVVEFRLKIMPKGY